MYKWHVHSAIGRSRPLATDFGKVADGIAASLRQFHVSASNAAEHSVHGQPSMSRAQRSAAAAKEISSLSPGGIDARTLAARPPPTFTIRRVEQNEQASQNRHGAVQSTAERGGYRGRGVGFRAGAGGLRGRGRGGARGGRGGRGGRKRIGGSRGGGVMAQDAGMNGLPYSPEEQAYIDSIEMGVPTPAPVGATDMESLMKEVPAVATSGEPLGMVETIRDHMRALSGQHGNEYLSSEQHGLRYHNGNGTFFVDDADKAKAIGPNKFRGAPKRYSMLPEAEREAILQTLVVGQHTPIKPMVKDDLLSIVDGYAQRNETYLPKDVATLRARVQKMLPVQRAAAPAKQASRQ